MGRNRKRYRRWIGLPAVFLLLAAGVSWYFIKTVPARQKGLLNDGDTGGVTRFNNGNDVVMATGVTETGMDIVTFAIDFLEDTSLFVEDVYLMAGETAGAGEAYIKFTDDSVKKARAELDRAVQTTDLAYRSGVISNGEDQIQAKYAYDTAALEAEYAQQVYQDTLTRLEMQFVRAEKACGEAQGAYNAYCLAVQNNTFYEDYQIEKLKKAYEDAYDLCEQRSDYYEVTVEELDRFNGNDSSADTKQTDRDWIVRSVALLQEEAQEAKAEYEQAEQAYQRELEGAELKLQKLLNQYEQARQSLTDAQLARQKGSLRAKTTYELTLAKGQVAKSDYDACLTRLGDELERLGEARDGAVKNKNLFEQLIGDGYLYTERAGTILKTYAEKEHALSGGAPILSYSSPGEAYVSVAMAQSDAEKLFVGQRASVTIENQGSYGGVVAAIQPVVIADGRTSMCDLVTVSLEGDGGVVASGQTATVIFGENGQDDVVQCGAGVYQTAQGRMASPMYDMDLYGQNHPGETENARAGYLKIEEVYVRAGQHVNAGDDVCRFAHESVESARRMLVRAQSDAHRALMDAQADYHINVLEAGLSHNEALLDTALAQTEYDNTIAKLNSRKVEKVLKIEQLLSEIYQLQTTMTDDDHQRQRADLARAYEKARKQVENAREQFVTSQVDAAQAFQSAREAYEAFFAQFGDSSRQIADKVAEIHAIQEEILQGQQLMEKELLAAEQTRIRAQTGGEAANARYASVVKEHENAVNRAQEELEQAKSRLDAFDRLVGDGVLRATESGLVAQVGYRKGDWLDDAGKLLSIVADGDMDRTAGKGGKEDTQ